MRSHSPASVFEPRWQVPVYHWAPGGLWPWQVQRICRMLRQLKRELGVPLPAPAVFEIDRYPSVSLQWRHSGGFPWIPRMAWVVLEYTDGWILSHRDTDEAPWARLRISSGPEALRPLEAIARWVLPPPLAIAGHYPEDDRFLFHGQAIQDPHIPWEFTYHADPCTSR